MDSQEIKVPKERVGVLIGVAGAVKKEIERKMDVDLHIDSDEGDVTITGENSLKVYEASSVVKAIGRGFNPRLAALLYSEDYMLDIMVIQDFIGRSKKHLMRIKGRIIGKEGKARKLIEAATETHISVYGKTIGIIGKVEQVAVARQALEMLLEGSPHGNVFKWLEHKKRELVRKEFEKQLPIA